MKFPHDTGIELVRTKCHIGEGARCCAYLTMGQGGFECIATSAEGVAMIAQRIDRMTAKSGPCKDPSDSFSEAVPYVMVEQTGFS